MPMLFFTLLCGIAAAVLRGFQLANSFDPQTSLIEPGDPATAALMALSALFAVAAAVYALTRGRKKEHAVKRAVKPLGRIWLAVQMLALSVLFSASATDVYRGFAEARVSSVCLGVLGLFAFAALLMVALSANKLSFTSATGFWMTVPVFWSCLMLIMEFWGHAGNPVRNAYVYGTLATVFCTLALYTVAGFFFNRVKTGRVLLYALPGIYFAALTLGGALLGQALGEPIFALSLSSLLHFAFITLHLSASVCAVLYGGFTPPPEKRDA